MDWRIRLKVVIAVPVKLAVRQILALTAQDGKMVLALPHEASV